MQWVARSFTKVYRKRLQDSTVASARDGLVALRHGFKIFQPLQTWEMHGDKETNLGEIRPSQLRKTIVLGSL